MSVQSSQLKTDQPSTWVSWKTIQFLVSSNLLYLVLSLGPYFVYKMPWRMSYSDPRDFWPYGYEGLGVVLWFLARVVADSTPILLPLMAIIVGSVVRPFWQQQGREAKVIIFLSIAITGLVGASSWFLNPDVTYWLND
jgi:hypothetical protein